MKNTLCAVLCLLLAGCFEPPSTETDPAKYSSLLTRWKQTGLVAHFPDPLPAASTNTKLSAFPGFLQGGAWFQIRFTLPPEEVAKIHDLATDTAKDVYDGGDFSGSFTAKKGGLAGTNFYTADTQRMDFPEDYRIFVFAATSTGGDTWNHGRSHGVVVSKQRNEVIYYAERW